MHAHDLIVGTVLDTLLGIGIVHNAMHLCTRNGYALLLSLKILHLLTNFPCGHIQQYQLVPFNDSVELN